MLETPPNKSYAELFDEKIFPVLFERHEKFPEGESLDDLSARAKEAVAECILPHVVPENVSGGYHIALASHGLAISELVSALLRLDPTAPQDVSYTGLLNTAWTRVHVSLQVIFHIPPIAFTEVQGLIYFTKGCTRRPHRPQ